MMTDRESSPSGTEPVVSVIMANYNCAGYVADAISSVQGQSLRNLELIVSDDGSSDDSVRIVENAAVADERIHLIRHEPNSGPSAARNRALSVARGKWIAIMDSDDVMHPDRLSTLVQAAECDGADIVADDVVEFASDISRPARRLLTGRWSSGPFWVDIHEYVRINRFYGRGPALGYLKPIFRSSLFSTPTMRYDDALTVAEDFDLVLRLLQGGKRFRVYPLQLYYYRKHAASTSHRLTQGALISLKNATLRFLDQLPESDLRLSSSIRARVRSIDTALAYETLLIMLKRGDWLKFVGAAVKRPQAAALLRLPIGVRLRRSLRGWMRCKTETSVSTSKDDTDVTRQEAAP